MAKKSTTSKAAPKAAPAPPVEPPVEPPVATPDPALQSPEGRAWLHHHLHAAEQELAHGPDGGGWRHNESLLPALKEHVAFLQALINLLP